jgi:hypothetical protein
MHVLEVQAFVYKSLSSNSTTVWHNGYWKGGMPVFSLGTTTCWCGEWCQSYFYMASHVWRWCFYTHTIFTCSHWIIWLLKWICISHTHTHNVLGIIYSCIWCLKLNWI